MKRKLSICDGGQGVSLTKERFWNKALPFKYIMSESAIKPHLPDKVRGIGIIPRGAKYNEVYYIGERFFCSPFYWNKPKLKNFITLRESNPVIDGFDTPDEI